jgi:predicted CXXCH cytochrome family protein
MAQGNTHRDGTSTTTGTHVTTEKGGRTVRRLAIMGIGGALWLILCAIPALADGGPHVMSSNNGTGGIKADGCASCHRIHTSQSPTGFLLVTSEATITDYCRSCHGATGTGAATDVDRGVQYALSGIARTSTEVGALRSGGFISARIGSGSAYRLVSATGSTSNAKVPVAASGSPVTSAHLAIGGAGGNGLTARNIVWGNGALGSAGAGPTLASEMECTACHNPHGNGNYRILQGIPNAGSAQTTAATAVNVTDATFDPARTRNYTVIQVAGTPGTESSYLLYADQVLGTYDALSGDYFHKNVPYNVSTASTYSYDGPNGRPNRSNNSATGYGYLDPAGFNNQMTNWCSQCHTRYLAASGARSTPSGDATFMYRHTTAKNRTCSTCHVAHGSNAIMNTNPVNGTTYSANVPFPDNSAGNGDSRLLKVDNRGTCLLCHDPTAGSAATAAGVDPLAQGPVPVLFP